MIVPAEQIKEALKSEREQPPDFDGYHEFLIQTKPPEKETVVTVQPGVGKLAKCRAYIDDVWQNSKDGGSVVRCKLLPLEERPLYLSKASDGGYTTDPSQAQQDEAGVAEWAPPRRWTDPGLEARERHRRAIHSDQLEERLREVTTWDELVRLKQLARSLGVDIRTDLRIVEERVEAIKVAEAAIGRRVEAIKDKIRERHDQQAA